jgi:hypothetical protein
MNILRNIILFISLISWCSCSCQINTKNAPKNLSEAIAYLNNDWSAADKLEFKNQAEDKAVTSRHFSVGLWIRNTWIRNGSAPDLVKYFNKIGIHAPDDMSSIILTSFHRQLNHKPLDLPGQVKPYKLYWQSIDNCETKSRKIALKNYNRFSVGDSITILMPVDTADKERNAVLYDCPTVAWKFNPKKDLIINGTVFEKHFINSRNNVFFGVAIKKMNNPNTTILGKRAEIGDIMNFSLENLTIK